MTKRTYDLDVLGIGICTVDLLFSLSEHPKFAHGIRADQYIQQGGGPVPTALVALTKLDPSLQCGFIGKIGDDHYGDMIRSDLQKAGILTKHMVKVPETRSRLTIVLVEQITGERGFIDAPESCGELNVSDIKRNLIENARILHIDDADSACLQAARWAKKAGNIVVFDGTWPNDNLEELLSFVDVPIVSDPLIKRWRPELTPPEVVEYLADFGATLAIYTMGENGCIARWDNHNHCLPAFKTSVTDTTGAGDAFHGAMILGLLNNWDFEKSLRFSSAVGALNCNEIGGRTALPTIEDVEEFLTKHHKE